MSAAYRLQEPTDTLGAGDRTRTCTPLREGDFKSSASTSSATPAGGDSISESKGWHEGRIATGATREEVERSMREAIEFHLDGLRREGRPVPSPHAYSTYVDVLA